jgi:hypothetical protein
MARGREDATATLLGNGRVLLAGGAAPTGFSTWTATGPMVYPYAAAAAAAAAVLPNGQVLYAGGFKVRYCGPYSCNDPIPDAELFTP